MIEDSDKKLTIELHLFLHTKEDVVLGRNNVASASVENDFLKKSIKSTLESIKIERLNLQDKLKEVIQENLELRNEINRLRVAKRE